MKIILISFLLLISSYTIFAQRVINKKIDVRYVQLPLTVMPDVITYNCVWDKDSIKESIPEIDPQLGYNDMMIKGCMAIQGLTYSETNPDITVTLQSSPCEFIEPIIININEGQENPNYKIKYSFPMNWKIKITGKFETEFELNPSKAITFYFPDFFYTNSTEDITDPYTLSSKLDLNRDRIYQAATRKFLEIAMQKVETKIRTELAYLSRVKEVEIKSFKTTKKVDMTEWDKPYERGQELLTKISSGKSPDQLYNEYNDIFSFWDEQLLSYKADEKENKKFIKVTFHNLINTLELVNPAAIKDEYFDIYSNISEHESNKIKSRIINTQKRQLASKNNTLDYEFLSKLLPIRYGNKYEVEYTTSNGNKNLGLIYHGIGYKHGLNPYQTGTGFNIYSKEICLERNGKVYDKHKVDTKKITSYELFGYKYVKLKFADPTAISLGSNEFFVQELISGKVSLYKHWEMEQGEGQIAGAGIGNNSIGQLEKSRTNPAYIIDLGKKKTLIYNYKKLTKFFEDCQPVVDKINSGAYGNSPINTKTSKLGNALQNALESNFKEEILIEIVNEYNSLMH